MVELADRVGRNYTTVSRQVAKLESLGLVERQGRATDHRVREETSPRKVRQMTNLIDAAREGLAAALSRRGMHTTSMSWCDSCGSLRML